MVKKIGDYKIADLYQGGYASLDPEYGDIFTGYRTSVGSMGITTDPRTANIIKEFSEKIAPGQKTIELSMIMPEVEQSVPGQDWEEVKRMSKLTGVDVTVHGPLIEASGLSKEGFSEANREAAERQMVQSVEKAHQVNPTETSLINFHSSAMIPAPEFRRIPEEERKRLGIKETEETEKLLVIDQESGQIHPVRKEEKFYPHLKELEKGKKYTAEEQVEIMNNSQWTDSLTQLILPIEQTSRMIEETYPLAMQIEQKLASGFKEKDLTSTELEVRQRFRSAYDQLGDAKMHLDALFNKAYKYGSAHEKRELEKVADNLKKSMEENHGNIKVFSNSLQQLRGALTKFRPELFKTINDFAADKSVKTFGNVAFESYKKFGDKTPIISIENPPVGMNAFARGEELKNLVEKAREQFVERAVDQGMDKARAKQQAEKLIGVSWDVGHINQLRKFGFTKEDIVKETEKIAPYLKHVHISDNFGMENTELPPGMGNVPIKEMMEKLGKKGEEAKKIIEAGNWWQHFRTSPMGLSFEALGSPIYSMKLAPYWNQAAGYQEGYFSGIGPTLPQINYETFGGGFSQLPAELGGQRGGGRGGRMSGTPME